MRLVFIFIRVLDVVILFVLFSFRDGGLSFRFRHRRRRRRVHPSSRHSYILLFFVGVVGILSGRFGVIGVFFQSHKLRGRGFHIRICLRRRRGRGGYAFLLVQLFALPLFLVLLVFPERVRRISSFEMGIFLQRKPRESISLSPERFSHRSTFIDR